MSKLYRILKGIGKVTKFAKLVGILVETVEFFNQRCREEFPEIIDVEPEKVVSDGNKLLKQ